jgi:hypothetical protein
MSIEIGGSGTMALSDAVAGLQSKQPQLARAPELAAGGRLQVGTVKVFLTEQESTVETDHGHMIDARQAASCLLAPTIGDRVLLYADENEAHILAVLERGTTMHAAEISVPGARKLTLRSAEKLELTAPKVTIATNEMNVFARALGQTGEILTSSFRRILENVVDKTIGARTITTRAQARTAVVSEVDTVNAGTLVQNIDKVATQNSEISMVTAKQDVRLDAKRVSVG